MNFKIKLFYYLFMFETKEIKKINVIVKVSVLLK